MKFNYIISKKRTFQQHFLLIGLLLLLFQFGFSQTHVNRDWMSDFGYPDTLTWSKSTPLTADQEIHIGNTTNAQQGVELLITLMDVNGNIDWQETFTTGATHNCYGVDVITKNQDIYVVGTTDNGGSFHDVLILKYDNLGNLDWSETYNSPDQLDDVATSIDIDANDDLYIGAASQGDTTGFDYLVLKYDSSGTYLWDTRYDYNNLIDIPVEVDYMGSRVFVSGASASSATRWDYTTIFLDASSGAYLGDRRDSVPGVGHDMPYDMVTDDDGNIYVTGRTSSNGVDYDIRTVKMDSALNIIWTENYDFQGLYDVGQTIELDDFGNLYVGGYVTRANNVEEMVLIKYDASNGNELWDYQRASEDFTEPAQIVDLSASTNGDVFFLGQEMAKNGYNRLVVGKMTESGKTKWQRYTHQTNHETPLSIKWYDDTLIYVNSAIETGQGYEYLTRRYTEFTQDTSLVYIGDTLPAYRSNELIVRFKHDAVNKDAVDNLLEKRAEFEQLDYFLTPIAMETIDEMMLAERLCEPNGSDQNICELTAVKLFKHLTTDYKTTTSRMGETIRVPDFWTSFLISFPEHLDIEDVYNVFDGLDDVVAYVEGNYIIDPTSIGVNDHYFVNENQRSIYSENSLINPNDPNDTTWNESIKIKDAWEIFPEAGRPDIRCGVTDRAIQFAHEDFGYDIDDHLTSSKVRGGYDYVSGKKLYDYGNLTADDSWHGTECAGIIGAIRNNEDGIAGIAGGDYQGNNDPLLDGYFDDKGVSLYSLIIYDLEYGPEVPVPDPIQSVYEAFVMSSIDDDSLETAFGLHVNSNSWSTHFLPGSQNAIYNDTNLRLITEATRFANRAKVSMVASRGNAAKNEVEAETIFTYPACIDDDWVTNVGGTGSQGVYPFSSEIPGGGLPMYSHGVDFSAPAVSSLITTTKVNSAQGFTYGGFNRTSAAAPHVSGVVSLILGYLNDTVPSYDNLCPEDCEHILELTADNYYNLGQYSDTLGWGKMNAGAAFHLIDKQYNTLHHFGSNTQFNHQTSYNLENSSISVYLKENIQDTSNNWYSRGYHDVNVYKVETTVYHSIDPIDTIVAYWGRPSSSTVMEPVINDSLLPRERVYIDFIDRDSAVLHGYVYEMLDNSGTPIGWLPRDTTLNDDLWLEYTILSRDSTAPVVALEQDELNDKITLYPNPTSVSQTLKIEGFANQNVFITLYDIQGRSLGVVHEGKLEDETVLEFNVSGLSNGFYLYDVRMETERRTLRFIKQ